VKSWPLLGICLILGACGQDTPVDTVASGSSSEVPNALTGTVSDASGWPVAGVKVSLRPLDLSHPQSQQDDSTTSDGAGHWSLVIPTGSWVLEFTNGTDSWLSRITNVLDGNISLSGTRRDTLRTSGWLKGRVRVPKGSAPAQVEIAGTAHIAQCDSTGHFLLGPVPATLLRLVTRFDSTGVPLMDLLDVTPVGGDTLDLGDLHGGSWEGEDYSAWPHSRKAVVDLTGKGAAVTGDHPAFPVLVRLDSILDPATQSRNGLRFDDGTGKHLPYLIETWDTASHRAEVWVRLDTANGSSNKHFLRVFWGLDKPLPAGSPSTFATEAHYVSAWHGALTDPWLSWTGATATQGIVGKGLHLDGLGQFRASAIAQRQQWSLGMWIRPTAKPSGEILLFGQDSGADSTQWGISLRDDLYIRIWSGHNPGKELVGPKALAVNQWCWISATFDTTSQPVGKMRIGLVQDTTPLPRMVLAAPSPSASTPHGFKDFIGDVDEFRLSDAARTQQWQQLEHQTTLPGIPWILWK